MKTRKFPFCYRFGTYKELEECGCHFAILNPDIRWQEVLIHDKNNYSNTAVFYFGETPSKETIKRLLKELVENAFE